MFKYKLLAAIVLVLSSNVHANTIQLPTTSQGNFNLTNIDINNDGYLDIIYTSTYETEGEPQADMCSEV